MKELDVSLLFPLVESIVFKGNDNELNKEILIKRLKNALDIADISTKNLTMELLETVLEGLVLKYSSDLYGIEFFISDQWIGFASKNKHEIIKKSQE